MGCTTPISNQEGPMHKFVITATLWVMLAMLIIFAANLLNQAIVQMSSL